MKILNFNGIIDVKSSLYFPQNSAVPADKCFPKVLGETKSNVKMVLWSEFVHLKVIEDDPDMLCFKYSYDSEYKNGS